MDSKTLIGKVAVATGKTPEEVLEMVAEMSKEIGERCVDSDVVVIPGFGQFEARKRKERLTIHPSTGQRLMVPPKLVMNFKPSGVLKQRCEK